VSKEVVEKTESQLKTLVSDTQYEVAVWHKVDDWRTGCQVLEEFFQSAGPS